jgi:hypothetical protein
MKLFCVKILKDSQPTGAEQETPEGELEERFIRA